MRLFKLFKGAGPEGGRLPPYPAISFIFLLGVNGWHPAVASCGDILWRHLWRCRLCLVASISVYVRLDPLFGCTQPHLTVFSLGRVAELIVMVFAPSGAIAYRLHCLRAADSSTDPKPTVKHFRSIPRTANHYRGHHRSSPSTPTEKGS